MTEQIGEYSKRKYRLRVTKEEDGSFRLSLHHPGGGLWFSFPAGVRFAVDGKDLMCVFREMRAEGDELIFRSAYPDGPLAEAALHFQLEDDCVTVAFRAGARQDIRIDAAEFFRNGRFGLYMVDCIHYFAPQPRNYFGINRAFHRNFCDCSTDGYFCPPPLNFSIGNRFGWVSFGLLDLPDSRHYQLSPDLGVIVEQPDGVICVKAGDTYRAPSLLLTFPEDEWQGETLFRSKLMEKGRIRDLKDRRDHYPEWWKKPLVVTYGDQIMDLQYNWYTDNDWGSPRFTQEWLEEWLKTAEERLGRTDFTIVVDAFWQYRWSAEPKPDRARFPDLRGFIEECHRRGHKVLLWTAPLIDSIRNDFEPLSRKMGVLSDVPVNGWEEEMRCIDVTSENLRAYLAELSRLFFSEDPDALDCDGLKLDFLASMQPTEKGGFSRPENGIGVKGYYRFYKIFQEEAAKVKGDVLLNGSFCDPRFEDTIPMNRLHDIQNVFEERELRARASVLASPCTIVDSDGAIMLSTWVEETYLNAVLYSTPSLYYVKKFHDGIAFSGEKMKALGALLSLSSRKMWGEPVFAGAGEWLLMRDGRTVGASFGGQTLLLLDKDGSRLYVFSWKSGRKTLPLFGMQPVQLPDGFTVSNGEITADLAGGEVYEIPLTALGEE